MPGTDIMLTGTVDPATRAALMVAVLDEDQAAKLLSKLEPDELKLLGERMCSLDNIEGDMIEEAIANFLERTKKLAFSGVNRTSQVRSLMTKAVGDVKAQNLMQRIAPNEERPSPLQLVRWLTPEALIPLITDEHPQAIAVLLVQLEAEVAARVLKGLPEDVQHEAVRRIASLGAVKSDALEILEEVLSRRISESHGHDVMKAGGPREAAEIINNSERSAEERILPAIAEVDAELAKKVEDEMFTFNDLLKLDPMSMGALLRAVESEDLMYALRGLPELELKVFLSAMSERASTSLREEIEELGRVKASDVHAARKKITLIARRMVEDGQIDIGGDDAGYV